MVKRTAGGGAIGGQPWAVAPPRRHFGHDHAAAPAQRELGEREAVRRGELRVAARRVVGGARAVPAWSGSQGLGSLRGLRGVRGVRDSGTQGLRDSGTAGVRVGARVRARHRVVASSGVGSREAGRGGRRERAGPGVLPVQRAPPAVIVHAAALILDRHAHRACALRGRTTVRGRARDGHNHLEVRRGT